MEQAQYHAPGEVSLAVALLGQPGAVALAGGTDLLVRLHGGGAEPSAIVDLKKIPGMAEVVLAADQVRIGAAATGMALTDNADLVALYPGVVEGAGLIGSTQVQSRATIGGNLCNGSPAADSVPALLAAGAVCEIAGPAGTRQLPIAQMLVGPGEVALAAGEVLTALVLPRPVAGQADAYLRFIPRTEMDIAVAGVAVNLVLDDAGVCQQAQVAMGGVGPTALLVPEAGAALAGSRLEDAALAAAGQAASAAARPISDKRASADYRRKIVAVLTRRAARIAAQRAAGHPGRAS